MPPPFPPHAARDVKQARVLRLPEGAFQVVLSGHFDDGQIAIPYGFGKIRLAHLSWRYTEGFSYAGTPMHVSPGAFVLFRLPRAGDVTCDPPNRGAYPKPLSVVLTTSVFQVLKEAAKGI